MQALAMTLSGPGSRRGCDKYCYVGKQASGIPSPAAGATFAAGSPFSRTDPVLVINRIALSLQISAKANS